MNAYLHASTYVPATLLLTFLSPRRGPWELTANRPLVRKRSIEECSECSRKRAHNPWKASARSRESAGSRCSCQWTVSAGWARSRSLPFAPLNIESRSADCFVANAGGLSVVALRLLCPTCLLHLKH